MDLHRALNCGLVLKEFKQSGKFVIAYGDYISQKAYYVASVANKIYCNPKGAVRNEKFSQLNCISKILWKNWRFNPRFSMTANSKVQQNRFAKKR